MSQRFLLERVKSRLLSVNASTDCSRTNRSVVIDFDCKIS